MHYHLENSPVLQDGLGINCVFQKEVVSRTKIPKSARDDDEHIGFTGNTAFQLEL